MANAFGEYPLIWYAQESLVRLEKALGFGSRVHRGYDLSPQQKGKTISIHKPGSFTAQDAPSSAQDIDAGGVQVTLDYWKDVVIGLTDAELQQNPDTIVSDHVAPMSYALADFVDAQLAGLYKKVPWHFEMDTASPIKNVTRAKQVLRQNGVMLKDVARIHFGIDDELEATFLEQNFFHAANIAAGAARETLIEGTLGRRLGVNFFPDGNIAQHTSGTVVSAGTDVAGAVNKAGGAAKGDTTLPVDGLSGTETLKEGDAFVIAGNTQRYVVTADAALVAGAATLSISPALVQAYADDAVVTFEDGSGGAVHADAYHANLMFHRNFAALATAPLESEMSTQQARDQGIEVEIVSNEDSGLVLRMMKWYEPKDKKLYLSQDLLFGYSILDGNMAVKVRRDV